MPVFFNGRLLVTPAVESQIYDQPMQDRNLAAGNTVALIGRSTGGAPQAALAFSSPVQAREALIAGELLTAIEKAFAPSPETPGPSRVIGVRVNPATQSGLTLLDGVGQPAIVLASTDYGAYTQRIKVKVESGTTSGKKLTVQLDSAYYAKDNVARNALDVLYTGAEASATVTVTPTQVILRAPAGAGGTTLELATYDTVQTLADRINTVADFSATIAAGSANTPALYGLDSVNAQDCKSAAYTVTAHLQAAVDWLNSLGEGFVNATRPAAATSVPTNLAFTYLTGGSDGNVTNNDWQACFSALQAQDVQWVVPVTSDSAIHAMADAHCAYMSGVGHSERRAFVGGATGLSSAQAASAAAAINSDRTAYCYPGIYDYDAAGTLTLYAPYMTAALVAGGFAGINPGESMTNKPVRAQGLERDLQTLTDTDYLIQAGVLCLQRTGTRGIRVVKAISSWLTDRRYNRVEISTGVAADYVARSVRNALEPFKGRKASPLILAEARTVVESTLDDLARAEPIGLGLLAGDTTNPPWKNVQTSISGDVLRVSFQCSPVIPVNYVLITISVVPYSS